MDKVRFPPPLSNEQLIEIREANKLNPNPVITALLWEIRRYHNIACDAHQLVDSMTLPGISYIDMMIKGLRETLKDDPAVLHMLEWQNRLLAGPSG